MRVCRVCLTPQKKLLHVCVGVWVGGGGMSCLGRLTADDMAAIAVRVRLRALAVGFIDTRSFSWVCFWEVAFVACVCMYECMYARMYVCIYA